MDLHARPFGASTDFHRYVLARQVEFDIGERRALQVQSVFKFEDPNQHRKVQVLFKGISWIPGNFVDANAAISSWNSLVLERVQEVIFGDEEVAE